MTPEEYRIYNRDRMRKVRMEQRSYRIHVVILNREKKLLAHGKCPVCEMLLKSSFHIKCPYLDRNSAQK